MRRAVFEPWRVVFDLTGRWPRQEEAVAGLIGAFWSAVEDRRPPQAGARANIRLMFQAMVTRRHSPRAFSSPRIEN